jgi:hypothetical protein
MYSESKVRRESLRCGQNEVWSRLRGSNSGPCDYESHALPTELSRPAKIIPSSPLAYQARPEIELPRVSRYKQGFVAEFGVFPSDSGNQTLPVTGAKIIKTEIAEPVLDLLVSVLP